MGQQEFNCVRLIDVAEPAEALRQAFLVWIIYR
jgi:hypothetical protein